MAEAQGLGQEEAQVDDRAEEEAAFAEGFDGEGDEVAPTEPENIEPHAGADAGADANIEDPVDIRESVERTEGEPDRYEQRLRKMEGRWGELNAKFGEVNTTLERLLDATKTQTEVAGDVSPSKEQVIEATQSLEKFEALKEDFPEWAEAMEEQSAYLERKIKSEISAPENVVTREEAEALVQRGISLAVIGMRHPGWESTVGSEDFYGWLNDQKAAVRDLQHSQDPDDVIRLLDLYKGQGRIPAESAESPNRRRLENAIPPTSGGASPTDRVLTMEEAFRQGFEE